MRIVGIDPGLDGAVALIEDGQVETWDVPTITLPKAGKTSRSIDAYAMASMFQALKERGVEHVCIEMVANRQGLAAQGVLKMGESFGVMEGLLIALRIPWSTVYSQVWTKAMRVGSDKNVHRLTAQRLYPDSAHLFSRRCDDGRADAALIARWWQDDHLKTEIKLAS